MANKTFKQYLTEWNQDNLAPDMMAVDVDGNPVQLEKSSLVAGTSGTSGTSGIDGSSGTSGTSGIDGSSGTSGINGTSGSSGTSGIDGTSGSSGTSGTSGIGSSGTSGTSGIGTDGSSGTSGTSGIGADGSSGTSGTSGINGVDGSSGTSGTSGTSPISSFTYSVQAGTFSSIGLTGSPLYYDLPISPVMNDYVVSVNSNTPRDWTFTNRTNSSVRIETNSSTPFTDVIYYTISNLGTGNILAINGADGSSGTSGTSGINGADGSSGTSGTSGINGSSGTSGTSGTSPDAALYVPFTTLEDANALTGWLDGDNIDVSYNVTNRTVTLTGDLTYQFRGRKTTLTSPYTSTAHANTNGSWFLSSDDGVNIVWKLNTPWLFQDIMIAYVNYKGVSGDTFCIKEAHGIMDFESHEEFHSQIGTYRISGGSLIAGTYEINVSSNTATTPSFNAAVLKDEDVKTSVPQWNEGTYTTMYVGATSSSVFSTTNAYPFLADGVNFMKVNNPVTGTIVNGVSNRYYNVYQIIMPCASDTQSQKYRMIMLQPQATYTSEALAIAEDVRSLSLGELATLSPEFIIYSRITYLTGGFPNDGKCRLMNATYVVGNRTAQITIVGAASTDHASLSNLTWTSSAHIGTVNKLAGFDGTGLPVYYDAPLKTPITLTDGATITWNYALGFNAKVTLGGNRTLTLSNTVAGDYGTIIVTQDATGSRTLTISGTNKYAGGILTITSTANKSTILGFYYDGTSYWWNTSLNY